MFVWLVTSQTINDLWFSTSTTPSFWIYYSEFITHPKSQEEISHVKDYSLLALFKRAKWLSTNNKAGLIEDKLVTTSIPHETTQ